MRIIILLSIFACNVALLGTDNELHEITVHEESSDTIHKTSFFSKVTDTCLNSWLCLKNTEFDCPLSELSWSALEETATKTILSTATTIWSLVIARCWTDCLGKKRARARYKYKPD